MDWSFNLDFFKTKNYSSEIWYMATNYPCSSFACLWLCCFYSCAKGNKYKVDSKIVKCTFINYGDLRLKGTNCTTLYGNMLSLVMMSSFKSWKFLMGKNCFMFGFLTKLNGFYFF